MSTPKPDKKVEIDVWGGLYTNVDSHDGKPGETVQQINATCVIPGQLTVRGGMQPITFEN